MILYKFKGSTFTKEQCNEPPAGLIVTWSKDMIADQGGVRPFIRYFNWLMTQDNDEWHWMHYCKMRPTQDVFYVYVVILGRIRYRFYYGGFENGPTIGEKANGEPIETTRPRMILAGPIVKAPRKLFIKGFQGFRYTNEIF